MHLVFKIPRPQLATVSNDDRRNSSTLNADGKRNILANCHSGSHFAELAAFHLSVSSRHYTQPGFSSHIRSLHVYQKMRRGFTTPRKIFLCLCPSSPSSPWKLPLNPSKRNHSHHSLYLCLCPWPLCLCLCP